LQTSPIERLNVGVEATFTQQSKTIQGAETVVLILSRERIAC